MELRETIFNRKSVRNFKQEQIPDEIIVELIKRGAAAPSIANSQPWKFIAIKRKTLLTEIANIVRLKLDEIFPNEEVEELQKKKESVIKFSTFFENAPLLIAILSKPYQAVADSLAEKINSSHKELNASRNFPNIQSIGACVQNILLSIEDLGLGGCWLSSMLIAKKEIENVLNIKEPYNLAAFIAVGYPAGEHEPKPKKDIKELLEIIE